MLFQISLTALAAVAAATAVPAQAQQQAAAPTAMSRADVVKTIDARFAAIDTNKNGFVEKTELATVQAKVLEEAQAARQARMEAEFKKLDSNNDGNLSLAEFKLAAPAVRASETPDQMLAGFDTNKDGKVSADEYRADALASFDQVDANHDGTVTAQEVAAARKK